MTAGRPVCRAIARLRSHRACASAGIEEDFYLFRRRGLQETLPWDFIDAGPPKEQLWADYRKALEQ